MGQARELMDKLTDAFSYRNLEALREIYADDVVVTTPDAGTVRGIDEAIRYHQGMLDAFPEFRYEMTAMHESGDSAIDQGDVIGRNTGPLALPDGRTLPATGKEVRMRTIDVATVEGDRVKRHDLYFDQVEMLAQLGLLEAGAPAARP